MKLTIAEAASLLGISDDQVYDWIEESALPAQRIRGQYRINRAELLEWATERRIDISPGAFEKERSAPTLAAALRAGGIHQGVPAPNLETALRAIVDCLAIADEGDREMLRDILLARESTGVTPVGEGIAIPHVRAPIIVDSAGALISLSYLDRTITLADAGSNAIDIFFFLLSPTVHVHLAMLARLAHALRDPEFRAAVRSRNPEAIFRAATALEGPA
ncbi:MAG: PTS sugar transporter subunit IIA [Acidobacteria bacterium]|nr:PTS sugar transporter subunit IIA [Acidobacteriota bacterium]